MTSLPTPARLAAIALLRQQGVPRERIASKWVIDAWEQIDRGGYINDPRIRVPADAYRADVPADYPDPKFRDRFPAVRPDYIVAEAGPEPAASDDEHPFPRFAFTAWRRPPYHRVIGIRGPRPPANADDRPDARIE